MLRRWPILSRLRAPLAMLRRQPAMGAGIDFAALSVRRPRWLALRLLQALRARRREPVEPATSATPAAVEAALAPAGSAVPARPSLVRAAAAPGTRPARLALRPHALAPPPARQPAPVAMPAGGAEELPVGGSPATAGRFLALLAARTTEQPESGTPNPHHPALTIQRSPAAFVTPARPVEVGHRPGSPPAAALPAVLRTGLTASRAPSRAALLVAGGAASLAHRAAPGLAALAVARVAELPVSGVRPAGMPVTAAATEPAAAPEHAGVPAVGAAPAAAPNPPASVRRAAEPARPPSAEQRWRAAIRARPLEPARPFPASMAPLVQAVAGPTFKPSYTTGAATRQALAAAGAHGATTGSVIHLPHAPTPHRGEMLGVVAHELAHARNPVSRPRFLLHTPLGDADADERAASAVGRRVQSAASELGSMGAGIVDSLPVGGAAGLLGAGRHAAQAALDKLPGVNGLSTGDLGGSLVDRFRSQAGAIPDVSLPGLGSGGGFGLPAMPAMPTMPNLPAMPDLPGSPMDFVATAAGMVTGAGDGSAPAGGAPAASAPRAAAGATPDIDHLAAAIEERVLRQIERRGGRYAGVF